MNLLKNKQELLVDIFMICISIGAFLMAITGEFEASLLALCLNELTRLRTIKENVLPSIKKVSIKEGDTIVVKLPTNKDGEVLVDYKVAECYHKTIKETFPSNSIITTPLEMEVVSFE